MPRTIVIFVHGILSSAATWDKFLTLIKSDDDLRNFHGTTFDYPSPVLEVDPRRRIPDYDAIADALSLFISRDAEDFDRAVIVTHSQGGLIAQRYIAQMLRSGRGLDLRKISRVVMFSCPNDGADFLLGVRRGLWAWRHAQERQLRPLNEQVADARRVVLERAVFAKDISPSTCPIPFSVYAGLSDNIVKPGSAKGAFPIGGSLPGDHNSIIAPDSPSHASYRTLKWDLLRAAEGLLPITSPTPREMTEERKSDSILGLADLPGLFLECASDLDHLGHECDLRHPWCRALADNTISLRNYVLPRARTFGEMFDSSPKQLDILFKEWLSGKTQNLLLLGEYGAGKTSACLYFYRQMSEAYRGDPTNAPLPVYVALDAYSRRRPERDGLAGLLDHMTGATDLSAWRTREFTAGRHYIYILDGLDEMSASAAIGSIRANFELLRPFFTARSRVLLTCRTHLFASATDLETAVLGSGLAGELLTDIRSTREFRISEIQALSPREIQSIIGRVSPEEDPANVWDELGRYYDLQDLSRRPILLGLVLQSLPALRRIASKRRRITESDLYKAYVETCTLRELSNKRLPSDSEKKLRLAEEIASHMYAFGVGSIDRATLSAEIRKNYGDEIFSIADFQLFDYDTRDASFLSCNLAGEFRFLHRSFYEYFAARAFVASVSRQESLTSIWKARWLTQEIASFAAQLLTDPENRLRLREVLDLALNSSDPTILWNALHLLSLLDRSDLQEADIMIIATQIVPRGEIETRSVLVRQYARVAAKFVSANAGKNMISRVLYIVSSDPSEQADNNKTYVNYYGGADAACAAFLNHLSSPSSKYDRSLHLHVLGQLGSPVHVDQLREISELWSQSDRAAAQNTINQILAREGRSI